MSAQDKIREIKARLNVDIMLQMCFTKEERDLIYWALTNYESQLDKEERGQDDE